MCLGQQQGTKFGGIHAHGWGKWNRLFCWSIQLSIGDMQNMSTHVMNSVVSKNTWNACMHACIPIADNRQPRNLTGSLYNIWIHILYIDIIIYTSACVRGVLRDCYAMCLDHFIVVGWAQWTCFTASAVTWLMGPVAHDFPCPCIWTHTLMNAFIVKYMCLRPPAIAGPVRTSATSTLYTMLP